MKYNFWFVVGSQFLYGDEVLKTVEARAREMAETLSQNLPYPLIYKVTAKTNKEKGIGIIELVVEVKGIENLNAVINAFQSLPDVHSVKRIQMNSKVKMSPEQKVKPRNRK